MPKNLIFFLLITIVSPSVIFAFPEMIFSSANIIVVNKKKK